MTNIKLNRDNKKMTRSLTFPTFSQSTQSTPSAQLIGMKIFPSMNWIPTSSKPSKKVTHLSIPSANAIKATKATRFAMMLRIKAVPWDAPLLAASSNEESVLKDNKVNIFPYFFLVRLTIFQLECCPRQFLFLQFRGKKVLRRTAKPALPWQMLWSSVVLQLQRKYKPQEQYQTRSQILTP